MARAGVWHHLWPWILGPMGQWVSSVRAVVEDTSVTHGVWCFVAVTIHAVADDPLGETDCSTNAMQMQYLCNCYPYIYILSERILVE